MTRLLAGLTCRLVQGHQGSEFTQGSRLFDAWGGERKCFFQEVIHWHHKGDGHVILGASESGKQFTGHFLDQLQGVTVIYY
ncbi:MAG: hypothetical protein ACXV76_08725 [Halobacteriota archaeon]